MVSRTIVLTPELNAFIDELVDEGHHADADAVIREALGVLRRQHALRQAIRRRVGDLTRGAGADPNVDDLAAGLALRGTSER